MATNEYWLLPVAFYFEVMFDNTKLSFKEVSGIQTEMELEEITEGGVNNYTHSLPKRIKHGNLVLKRALCTTKYTDVVWIRNILEGENMNMINPKNILISLLNVEGKTIASWSCQRAFPVKWNLDALDSEKNSVLIETIEFSYTKLIRQQ